MLVTGGPFAFLLDPLVQKISTRLSEAPLLPDRFRRSSWAS
jgi:hypothetical protein